MKPFLLSLHLSGVLLGLGPAFAGPAIAPLLSKGTAEQARALCQAFRNMERMFFWPFTGLVIPGAGTGLILTEHLKPFGGDRWLLTAIILYAVAFAMGAFGQGPNLTKRIALLDAGKFRGPEWVAVSRSDRVLGMASVVVVFAILVLMVWKPAF